MILSALLILVAIPLTIYIGWNISERQFYITSLLIIVYTMIPFFLVFEKKKTTGEGIGSDRCDVCDCSGVESGIYLAAAF